MASTAWSTPEPTATHSAQPRPDAPMVSSISSKPPSDATAATTAEKFLALGSRLTPASRPVSNAKSTGNVLPLSTSSSPLGRMRVIARPSSSTPMVRYCFRLLSPSSPLLNDDAAGAAYEPGDCAGGYPGLPGG